MSISKSALSLATLALLTVGAEAAPQSGPATGPLQRHPTNPRYFTDGSGKAVYLTGSHTWANLKDIGPSNPPPAFDYTGYLNLLQANGHNFIRLWAWDLSRSHVDFGVYPWNGDQFVVHFPWPRSGPGVALDGRPKFNLAAFDQSFFDRLRARVIAARDRGIYVSVMLFEGWGLHSADAAWRWAGHPMHVSNNVNGIDGDPNRDNYGIEIQTLQLANVTNVQKAYLRKVVDTVNDLDNVLYEIANESGSWSTNWQYDLINTIKSYEAGKPKRHPVGMTFQWGSLGAGTNANLFNSPADWISPNGAGGYETNPPVATGAKVILPDTDHINPWLTDPVWVWRSFLRGHNPIVMDSYNGPQWDPIRRTMGYARSYANRMNLAATTPRNDLASTTYCLAAPGSEYLVYQPGSGTFTVNLAVGSYAVEWFNPATGAASSGGTAAGGGSVAFTAPFSGQAVLYLKSGAPPPPPPAGELVGHWALNEGTGTTVGDSSGKGNSGTLVNGAAWTAGKSGTAVALDGVNDHVLVPATSSLNSTTSRLTVAAWVYRSANQAGWRVVAARQRGLSWEDQYFLAFQDNACRFGVSTSGVSGLAAGGAAPTGQWIHLAGTYDGGTVRLYVNGQQAGAASASGSVLVDPTRPFLIGAGRNDGTSAVQEALSGRVDDVRLYSRALSASEIQSLMGATPPPPPPQDLSLSVHWKMDEGSGTTAQDASGKGNVGTLSPDGPVWTTGRSGSGLDFNGAGDYLSAPASASINSVKGQMTVSIWSYKRANLPTYGILAGRRQGTQYGDLWVLYYNHSASDEYSFGLTTSAGAAYLTGPASTGDHNTWVHVAAVYDGASVILYRNGAEIARRGHTGTVPDESGPLMLGAGDNGSAGIGEYTNAVLDGFQLHNRALSASEVQALFTAGGSTAKATLSASGDPEASPLSEGGAGGGGSCGALGLEFLLVVVLARVRRRVPRIAS